MTISKIKAENKMTIDLYIERHDIETDTPSDQDFEKWVDATLQNQHKPCAELSICLINEEEMGNYNQQYRKKSGPTNVLSFPTDIAKDIESNLLGDIIICSQVVEKEAQQQHKNLLQHFAHLTIHGTLHLLGYDHQTDAEAIEMENLETELLAQMGYPDPYQTI